VSATDCLSARRTAQKTVRKLFLGDKKEEDRSGLIQTCPSNKEKSKRLQEQLASSYKLSDKYENIMNLPSSFCLHQKDWPEQSGNYRRIWGKINNYTVTGAV
jgi:hypothetical protein